MRIVGQSCSGERSIAFVNRYFYPDESATSQILTDVAIHLAAEGWAVEVLTGRHADKRAEPLASEAEHQGVRIRRLWSLRLGKRSLLMRLLEFGSFYPSALLALLRDLKPGQLVVGKTDPPLISLVVATAAKVRGAKFLTWNQDLYPEVATQLDTPLLGGAIGKFLKHLRNSAFRTADLNIVIGDRMARFLQEQGIKEEKIVTIPNWSDDQGVSSDKDEAFSTLRAEWGLRCEDFVVAYSGNLGRAHEGDTIFQAAKLLAAREDIKFLVVGGGDENQKLRARVLKEQLSNFVFKPHQPRERLGAVLALADVHWLSLRPELEGLIVPSKLYGILAAGRPVIAVTAADGEAAEIIRRHGCGTSVPPGNAEALAAIIEDWSSLPDELARMGERGRLASVAHYSKSAALVRWSTVLTQLDDAPNDLPLIAERKGDAKLPASHNL
jgi:glycosyltransferase involved in cell wall biosynthesis